MAFTSISHGQILNLLYFRKKWPDCHETNNNISIECWVWIVAFILTLAMTLTLNFQGQILNLLFVRKKCSGCRKMRNEHKDLMLGLKSGCQFWPWLWPWPCWPWIFKVKYSNGHISRKKYLIAAKHKTNIYWLNAICPIVLKSDPSILTSVMTLTFYRSCL